MNVFDKTINIGFKIPLNLTFGLHENRVVHQRNLDNRLSVDYQNSFDVRLQVKETKISVYRQVTYGDHMSQCVVENKDAFEIIKHFDLNKSCEYYQIIYIK